MPKDPTLKLIYDRAAAEIADDQDQRLVAYMTNSWLRTTTQIRARAALDARTDAFRRAGIDAVLAAT